MCLLVGTVSRVRTYDVTHMYGPLLHTVNILGMHLHYKSLSVASSPDYRNKFVDTF